MKLNNFIHLGFWAYLSELLDFGFNRRRRWRFCRWGSFRCDCNRLDLFLELIDLILSCPDSTPLPTQIPSPQGVEEQATHHNGVNQGKCSPLQNPKLPINRKCILLEPITQYKTTKGKQTRSKKQFHGCPNRGRNGWTGFTLESKRKGNVSAVRGRAADFRWWVVSERSLWWSIECWEMTDLTGLGRFTGFEWVWCDLRETIGSLRRLSVVAMLFLWCVSGETEGR